MVRRHDEGARRISGGAKEESVWGVVGGAGGWKVCEGRVGSHLPGGVELGMGVLLGLGDREGGWE